MNTLHPYRDPPPQDNQLVVKVETDDVELTVWYQDIDNTVKQTVIAFTGSPSASNRYDKSINTYERRGSSQLTSWIKCSEESGIYHMGDLYIPQHRLLKLSEKVSLRTELIEPK